MSTVSIKDNSRIEATTLAPVKDIVAAVSDRSIARLSQEGLLVFPQSIQDSPDLDECQMVLEKDSGGYRSGNLMGYLGYQDEQLVIDSRFASSAGDFFLQYMMYRVLNIPNLSSLSIQSDLSTRLFQFHVFMFPYCLRGALRQGIYRTYIQHKYNDSHIRGRIDIPRHITTNIPFTGNIAYDVRELTADNPLTQLIRHTMEYIALQPYGSTLLGNIRKEVRYIIECTPSYRRANRSTVLEYNLRHPVNHAYFTQYRMLQQLCIIILSNQRHAFNGQENRLHGILFDGSWLWEEYVDSLIGDSFFHPRNKLKEGKQHLLEGGTGPIYPDFISRSKQHPIIADAKYKPISNIHKEDYWQILAYMYRFDSKLGIFLYPDAKQTSRKELHMLQGTTFHGDVKAREDIIVAKLGLSIPDTAVDYADFISRMSPCEKAFRTGLLNTFNTY